MVGRVLKPTQAYEEKNQTNQRTKNAVDLERIVKRKVTAKNTRKHKLKKEQKKRKLINH